MCMSKIQRAYDGRGRYIPVMKFERLLLMEGEKRKMCPSPLLHGESCHIGLLKLLQEGMWIWIHMLLPKLET